MTNMLHFRRLLLLILIRFYLWKLIQVVFFCAFVRSNHKDKVRNTWISHILISVCQSLTIVVLCFVYHAENLARSTAIDWHWCQEDIWGPICWRKIQHLSSWSLQIRAQSSFSAPYKKKKKSLFHAFCFPHCHPKITEGETIAVRFAANRLNG